MKDDVVMDGKIVDELGATNSSAKNKLKTRFHAVSLLRVALVLGGVLLVKILTGGSPVARYLFSRQVPLVVQDREAVWDTVRPSNVGSLTWVPCYDGKQCARLMVPLDYSEPNSSKAGIALLKVPSKFHPNDPKYRGPILFNPGGPGASGVGFINILGESFQKLIGEEFDIIGFDPRGVARTTPAVTIFNDEAEDAAWRVRIESDPVLGTSPDALARLYARAQVQSAVANRTTRGASPYVSTAIVARDMFSIVRAQGRDKLQYWGFSYGTVLGATFAAMFPDNVERLIIDGVVDSENYYAGLWSNNLLDTDTTLRMILDGCVAAGPSLCALYEPTTEEVHARLTAIFDKLKRQPVPVSNSTLAQEYGLIDYRTARLALFERLYSPYGGTALHPDYPAMTLLNALADIEQGKGLALGRITGDLPVKPPFHCNCQGSPRKPYGSGISYPDANIAIGCADGDSVRAEDTIEDLERYFAQLDQDSEFADQWPGRVFCVGWRLRPVERFAGPFVANTSFPMLLIGNTADPVTPLAHAFKMSQGFASSAVLHQDSAGHCSVAATSLCTAKTVREYFRDGKLPKNGTICPTESTIFPSFNETRTWLALQGKDREVMDAWKEIRTSYEVPKFGRFW